MRVVCISEELYERLKKLLEELSPVLVADIAKATGRIPTVTAEEMVLSVVEPDKTYTVGKIFRLVEEKYGVRMPEGTQSSTLTRLVKKGKLKRVARGTYQLL